MNNYFVTTAIPYINAKPHIGHVQEFLLTGKIVQILKSQGHEVKWQSGTDDNSLKNLASAQKQNIPIAEYLQQHIGNFKSLLNELNLKPDYLVHTSQDNHHEFTKNFIKSLNPTDLYESTYEGLYCQGCENFIKKEELINEVCPDHLTKPVSTKENNVFFKLSAYQDQIYNLILTDQVKIHPASRKNEILAFIKRGLNDISISRPVAEASLGVDFPGHQDHKVYVWIDALINYLSGINYFSPEGKELWDKSHKIHVIGKNVWKFHAIYWIGLLLSANIPVPNEIYIHGFLTNNGQKISKSLGNSVDVDDLLKEFTPEELSYYLLGKLNPLEDSDFNHKDLRKILIDDLSFKIGNLFPRVYTLSNKFNYSLEHKPVKLELNYQDTQ